MRLGLLLLASAAAAAQAAAAAGLANLTVDWVPADSATMEGQQPTVEGQQPTVRWVVPHSASRTPGTVQSSYRLKLWEALPPDSGGGRPAAAAAAAEDNAFDSGTVASPEAAVVYPGGVHDGGDGNSGSDSHHRRPSAGRRLPLLPDAAYSFTVEVTLSDGAVLRGGGGFNTGLQTDSRAAGWGGAEWIAGDAALPASAGARRNNLRAEWTLAAAPASASAFVAGIGALSQTATRDTSLCLLNGAGVPNSSPG